MIHPIEILHRAEPGETLAFGVQGPKRQLLYCPDIDSWAKVDQGLPAFLSQFDVALLDGTFYTVDELPGRDQELIPHPPVEETMGILSDVPCDVVFIHLNHTNPLLDDEKVQFSTKARGFQIGYEGQLWDLG